MSKNIKQGIIVVLLLFVGGVVLAIVDPSGKLWERLWKLVTSLLELADKYPYLSIAVFIILLIVFIWVHDRIVNREIYKAKKEHPNFFEEIRLILISILSPLGFQEYGRGGWKDEKTIEFIKDEFSVQLVGEKVVFRSSNKKEIVKHELVGEIEQPVYDFIITADIPKADESKREVTKKLNEWLIEQGIK